MHKYQKSQPHYERRYDELTVLRARQNLKVFLEFRKKYLDIMKNEKPSKFREDFHLNIFYMAMVGGELVDRYNGRDSEVRQMMIEDEVRDKKIAEARLQFEPSCHHCDKQGLRIIDKSLMRRTDSKEDEVLIMLKCSSCSKNSAVWHDGIAWGKMKINCNECGQEMAEKHSRNGKIISTKYDCSNCENSFTEKLDVTPEKEKADPDLESDIRTYCLKIKKVRDEHLDHKRRFDSMSELMDELRDKEDNKDIYEAINKLEKLKVAQLSDQLEPVLKKHGYIEFRLEKPDIGREFSVEFSCLDSKPDRKDYDSRKILKKQIDAALENTNWRLMTSGIN